jgi:hypothetical protein
MRAARAAWLQQVPLAAAVGMLQLTVMQQLPLLLLDSRL